MPRSTATSSLLDHFGGHAIGLVREVDNQQRRQGNHADDDHRRELLDRSHALTAPSRYRPAGPRIRLRAPHCTCAPTLVYGTACSGE